MDVLPLELILIIVEYVNNYAKGIHTLLLTRRDLRDYVKDKPEYLSKLKLQVCKEVTELKDEIFPSMYTCMSVGYSVLPNNKKHGKYEEYNSHGKVLFRTNYCEGVENGDRIQFSPRDSTVIWRERYKNGLLHGSTKGWDKKGNLTFYEYYSEGKVQDLCLAKTKKGCGCKRKITWGKLCTFHNNRKRSGYVTLATVKEYYDREKFFCVYIAGKYFKIAKIVDDKRPKY